MSEEPRLSSGTPETLATGLDHPEAVCWSPEERLILAGGEAGQLYSVALDGAVYERSLSEGSDLLGIALDGHGNTFLCDCNGGTMLRTPPGGSPVPFGPRMVYPNYPAFDAEGVLWVSDSGHWGSGNGLLRGLLPDGSEVDADFGRFEFSNGLAIADRTAYLVTSYDPAVWTIDLDSGDAEILVRLPRTVPDGVALDAEGGVWISCFQPNRIYRLHPDGTLELVLDDWSGEQFLSPTNICFAGDDLKTIVMASLCGRTLSRFESWVAGRPLEYPRNPAGAGS